MAKEPQEVSSREKTVIRRIAKFIDDYLKRLDPKNNYGLVLDDHYPIKVERSTPEEAILYGTRKHVFRIGVDHNTTGLCSGREYTDLIELAYFPDSERVSVRRVGKSPITILEDRLYTLKDDIQWRLAGGDRLLDARPSRIKAPPYDHPLSPCKPKPGKSRISA